MKIITTTIIALAILLASCSETTETVVAENISETESETVETVSTPDLVEEEVLQPEGSEVEGDDRYANLSNETANSDCFIVSHFIDNDITYVTVDFIDYKLDEDSKNTDVEIYDIINENTKLRTFVVNEDYLKCGRSKKATISELLEKSKEDPKTIFSIEIVDGLVIELYIDTCSG